jgi:hypothetical protein
VQKKIKFVPIRLCYAEYVSLPGALKPLLRAAVFYHYFTGCIPQSTPAESKLVLHPMTALGKLRQVPSWHESLGLISDCQMHWATCRPRIIDHPHTLPLFVHVVQAVPPDMVRSPQCETAVSSVHSAPSLPLLPHREPTIYKTQSNPVLRSARPRQIVNELCAEQTRGNVTVL